MPTEISDENSSSEQFAHGTAHIAWLLNHSPLYGHLFSSIKLENVEKGVAVCSFLLEPRHVNSKSSLHGSVSATLVDFMGGLAIACADSRDNTGVSTDIHISYTAGARSGDTLYASAEVVKLGRTLAYTRVEIWRHLNNEQDSEKIIVATGSHTKFVGSK